MSTENLGWSNGYDGLSRAGTDLANGPHFFQKFSPLQPPFIWLAFRWKFEKKILIRNNCILIRLF